MLSLLLEEDACCLGTQRYKTIIQKFFDDRLCSGISERPKTFQMLCYEIDQLVSQVIQSHRAKSRDFLDAHGGICLVKWFPS